MNVVKDVPKEKEMLHIGRTYIIRQNEKVHTGMLLKSIEREDALLFILTTGEKLKCHVDETVDFESTVIPSYIHDKMENILNAYRRLEIAEVIKARKERAILDEQREILISQNELMAMSVEIH